MEVRMVAARTKSLRSHLIIFGFLIVIPLLIVGVCLAVLYVTAERAALQEEANQVVREAKFSVDRELQRYASALDVLANSANLNQGNFQELYNLALAVTKAIPRSAINLRTVGGETIFSTLRPFGAVLPEADHQRLMEAHHETIKKGHVAISDLWIGSITRSPWIGLVQPIASNKDNRYVLILGIEAGSISEIINSQLKSKQWLIGVVGKDNVIISRTWQPERFVGQKATEGYIQNAKGDAGTFYNTTLEGVQVFNTYVRSDLTGWTFVAAVPVAELQAPLRRSALALFGLLTFGSALSVLLSYLYAIFLLKPAAKLLELAAGPFAANDLRHNTGVKEFDYVTQKIASTMAALKKRDKERAVLIDELNHRGRNMLAAIQSIAYQSVRRARSLKGFETSFNGRLGALAKSYALLTRNDWRSVDLKQLILECSEPFAEAGKIQLSGPELRLQSKAVTGMAMIIHELCTNATKYGSLKHPTGSISVGWAVLTIENKKAIKFEWKEKGLSIPSDGPLKQGFGSHLITSIVEKEFGSKMSKRFDPHGLYFAMSIPLDFLDLSENDHDQGTQTENSSVMPDSPSIASV
jgi:two-component sensor histidine kinase